MATNEQLEPDILYPIPTAIHLQNACKGTLKTSILHVYELLSSSQRGHFLPFYLVLIGYGVYNQITIVKRIKYFIIENQTYLSHNFFLY